MRYDSKEHMKAELYTPRFPTDWEEHSLYDLAVWQNGLAFRAIHFSERGMPVIKIAEIKGGVSEQTKFTSKAYDEAVRVKAGDLLFSWSGQPETSIDVFQWQGPEGWLNQHIFKLTSRGNLCSQEFLFYLLKYLKSNLISIARNKQTTGLGHVTKRDLKSMKVRVPSLTEQRHIVDLLAPLDKKIVFNTTLSRTLEQLASAIFRAWFVDFEPVKAKMAGARSFLGMPEEAFNALPAQLADSDHGLVPEGWKWVRIDSVAEINRCSVGVKNAPESIRYVDISAVGSGEIRAVTPYQWGDAPSRARRLVQEGDIIWSCVRPERRSYALIAKSQAGLVVSTGFAVMTPTGVPASYLYAWVTDDTFVDYLVANATGSAYPAVRADHFASARLLMPPDWLLAAFDAIVQPLRDWIANASREHGALTKLRDELLPRLLSGDVRVQSAREGS